MSSTTVWVQWWVACPNNNTIRMVVTVSLDSCHLPVSGTSIIHVLFHKPPVSYFKLDRNGSAPYTRELQSDSFFSLYRTSLVQSSLSISTSLVGRTNKSRCIAVCSYSRVKDLKYLSHICTSASIMVNHVLAVQASKPVQFPASSLRQDPII